MSNGYQPGHDAFVAWALETTSTTSYGNWDTDEDDVEMPAAPAVTAYAGYCANSPKVTDTYGSKKGTAVGSYLPLYDADGAVQYEVQVEMAVGSIPLIQKCLRDGTGLYGLPDICLFVGQKGSYTDVYRYCKCNTLQISLKSGSAQELTASATFWPLARQTGSILNPTRQNLQALGEPLFWHDVQTVHLREVDKRRYFMGASINVNHNLERKEIRPHRGQGNELSLVPYEIMPHLQVTDGELTMHAQLAEAFYTENPVGGLARRWGDLTFGITDGARLAVPEDEGDAPTPKVFNLELTNVVPQSRSKGGAEASAEVQYTVPILADDLVISV